MGADDPPALDKREHVPPLPGVQSRATEHQDGGALSLDLEIVESVPIDLDVRHFQSSRVPYLQSVMDVYPILSLLDGKFYLMNGKWAEVNGLPEGLISVPYILCS